LIQTTPFYHISVGSNCHTGLSDGGKKTVPPIYKLTEQQSYKAVLAAESWKVKTFMGYKVGGIY
jgi:hypothetical protein